QKLVEASNRDLTRAGRLPLRTGEETVNGRTYYMIAGGDPNPLTEAHYTFADGYMIAAPSRALIDSALQTHTNGLGIIKSEAVLALLPRDRYANASALVYQNLGTTLAPLAGLLGSMAQVSPEGQKALGNLSNMKPTLVAVYGEPDRIEVAGTGDQFNLLIGPLVNGQLSQILASAVPGLARAVHR